MIFSIDFDGTIVENAWPDIGKLNPDAVDFIQTIKGARHTFILNTLRTGDKLKAAVDFLKEHDLAPDYVNENTKGVIECFDGDSRKIFADVYIDDRNAGGLVWPVLRLKNAKEEK